MNELLEIKNKCLKICKDEEEMANKIILYKKHNKIDYLIKVCLNLIKVRKKKYVDYYLYINKECDYYLQHLSLTNQINEFIISTSERLSFYQQISKHTKIIEFNSRFEEYLPSELQQLIIDIYLNTVKIQEDNIFVGTLSLVNKLWYKQIHSNQEKYNNIVNDRVFYKIACKQLMHNEIVDYQKGSYELCYMNRTKKILDLHIPYEIVGYNINLNTKCLKNFIEPILNREEDLSSDDLRYLITNINLLKIFKQMFPTYYRSSLEFFIELLVARFLDIKDYHIVSRQFEYRQNSWVLHEIDPYELIAGAINKGRINNTFGYGTLGLYDPYESLLDNIKAKQLKYFMKN